MEVKIEEFWIVIPQYPRFLISNTGKVYDKESTEILPQKLKAKYYWVILPGLHWTKRHWMTHRLMIFAFTGVLTSRTLQCNHIDGDKLNNNICNLELVTPSENATHAFRTGLNPGAWYKVKQTEHYKKYKAEHP